MILTALLGLSIGACLGALIIAIFASQNYNRGYEDAMKTQARMKREARRLFEQEAGR